MDQKDQLHYAVKSSAIKKMKVLYHHLLEKSCEEKDSGVLVNSRLAMSR